MKSQFFALTLMAAIGLTACGDKAEQPSAATNTVTPTPVKYQATLAEGIDFKKDGYPAFIKEVEGISNYEQWGRWSDADAGGPVVRFTFKEKLPEAFKLVVTANVFGPNEGKPIEVKAGQVSQKFIIKNASEPNSYTINFQKVNGNTLEFTPPSPTSPASLDKETPDVRKLGIAFIAIKIQ